MSHLFFSTLPSTNTNTQSTRTHTRTYAFTHTQTTKQSHVFRVGQKKKEREENKEENLELCVSRGRRRCGIVLLSLPLMHAHAPGRFNSTFDLLWHEIYYSHTHTVEHTQSARGNHLHLSFMVRTVENCRLPRSMHTQYPLPLSPPPSTTFFPYFLVSFCRIEWSKFLSGDLINILLNVRTTGTKFQNAEANQCGIATPPCHFCQPACASWSRQQIYANGFLYGCL